jgi:isopentenyl-diphosphate Delta-isomerase
MTTTEQRKQDHLDLCLEKNVSSLESAGWDDIRLPHKALPELAWDEVSTQTQFLKQSFEAPFLISSMTGGSPQGETLNKQLALLAQEKKIPMGVGSQRVALESRHKKHFELRKAAPQAVLYANIGAVQLNYGVTPADCAWLVDELQAQALIVHANPLQEIIQHEGDRNFAQLWNKLDLLKKTISVPIILKETGCGLDYQSAQHAVNCGIDAIDSAGLGGTHWGFIEGLRHPQRQALGEIFRDWGIPSLQSLQACLKASGGRIPVIASGGIRNGLDAAKALHMGAQLAGMALPFLKAAQNGEEKLFEFYDLQHEALKTALFCMGCRDLPSLRGLS